MPELAEVEFFRRKWNAGYGRNVLAVELHPRARVFRGTPAKAIAAALRGRVYEWSATAAKQMLFRFGRGESTPGAANRVGCPPAWLGIHLGMSGELATHPPGHPPGKHDHLVLRTATAALVFTDPRMFGRVQLHVGEAPPLWWTRLAPPILSAEFTPNVVAEFLRRRRGAPIKAVLLMQERFPGIGNWMADEILWRAAIHPRRAAGSLTPTEVRAAWRESRRVCRMALATIAGRTEADTPAALNLHIPDTWLFNHRWRDGGVCPRTGRPLVRAEIGGRTTCWSPVRQKWRG
jgi:formamidopyrimidine-DNA glycosylase